MIASVRAELFRLGRWPTTWVLGGVWVLMNLAFGYLFDYLAWRGADGKPAASGVDAGVDPAALLANIQPHNVPVTLVQGMPMFGGALVLILGALAIGSGYGWGTWKTVFTTGPRRATAIGGTVAAIGVIVTGMVLLTLGLDFATSLVIAAATDQPVVLPTVGALAQGLGGGLLICAMWAAGGVLLGTLTRGPALSVGLGLVWALVVENLLRGIGTAVGAVDAITHGLPGTAAGSLARAVGAVPAEAANGTPGVNGILGSGTAIAVVAAYLVLFVAATALITSRRDVTA
jgi:ABC-2 type transport system permease protein